MNNPWLDIPDEPPYVLPSDCESIARLNVKLKNDCSINERSIPEPFIGNPESATVILLSLNPGDVSEDPETHRNPRFRDALMGNLRHELRDYPFYALNPAFAWTGCAKWWNKHLNPLFAEITPENVARRLCVVEWFPYHSKKSGLPSEPVCPSQEYSFELAKRMIGRKLIVGMRARKRWVAVDECFDKIRWLNSVQNPVISQSNVGEDFRKIVEALSS